MSTPTITQTPKVHHVLGMKMQNHTTEAPIMIHGRSFLLVERLPIESESPNGLASATAEDYRKAARKVPLIGWRQVWHFMWCLCDSEQLHDEESG